MKRTVLVLILVSYVLHAVTQTKFIANRYKKITVYTTAENTSYRLSVTDTLQLASFGQPLETQPCIFIDAGKKFQQFIGIGGAITDAVAETYAKLPKETQKEFLDAYYDKQKGIS